MENVIELEVGEGRHDGTYAVRVVRSLAGGEPVGTFTLDIAELLAQRALIEATVLSSAVPTRRLTSVAEQPIRAMGQKLFESMFTGPVAGAYRASLGVAHERETGLQVVLRLTAKGLAALPWETMYDPDIGAYVCRKEPLVRHVAAPFTAELLAVQSPLRILGMVASPRGLPVLDVRAERQRLDDALRHHIDAGRVELVWLDDVSWAGVHDALLEESWHMLHFIGHGGYDTETDEGVLALVGLDGRADYVGASNLADLLDEAEPTPRLVVLNSCASGATGAEDLFSGTAAALVRSGMHAVAAMQFAVSDGAAIAFARGLYTAIASGRAVDTAVRSGRIAMLGTGRNTLEWVTPVLYLRGASTPLFSIAPGSASSDRGQRASVSVPPSAPDGVLPERRGHPPHDEHIAAQSPAAEPSEPADAGLGPDQGERTGAGRGTGERPPRPVNRPSAPPEVAPAAVGSTTQRVPRRRLIIRGAAVLAVAGLVTVTVVTGFDVLGGDDGRGSSTSGDSRRQGSAQRTVQTAIPATQVWTRADISCKAGDTLEITVSGTVMHERSTSGEVGPEGLGDPKYHQWNVAGLPDANTVAAIGSLDKQSPFIVGSGTTHTCERDGDLFLGVNDVGVANNAGHFNATITRRPDA